MRTKNSAIVIIISNTVASVVREALCKLITLDSRAAVSIDKGVRIVFNRNGVELGDNRRDN